MLGCHGSLLLLPCSSRRPLGIARGRCWGDARQPMGRFCPSSTCQSPGRSASGLRMPDTLVYCGCRPFQKPPRTHLSVPLGSWMMARVHIPVGFTLTASSFAKAPKSESIAVCGTVLSIRHRFGVFWVQTSSEAYCLLQLGSLRSPF